MPHVWIVVYDDGQIEVSLLTEWGDFDTYLFDTWPSILEFVHLNRPDWEIHINHEKEV